jgi:cytochrome c553
VYFITFSGLASLLFITAFAAAATAPANEKPVPPTPGALQEKLAQISQDAAKRTAALKEGRKSAAFCRHCHGAAGNSVLPEVPNLASQNAVYLLEQMNKFAQGQRKSQFMEGLIKALTPDERVNIALFLSRQPVTRKPATGTAQAAEGKALYLKLCVNCHGANATGSNKIPRLAGQQSVYLQDSLKRYRSGSGERIDPKMSAFTHNLKDADIDNLAAYLSALP